MARELTRLRQDARRRGSCRIQEWQERSETIKYGTMVLRSDLSVNILRASITQTDLRTTCTAARQTVPPHSKKASHHGSHQSAASASARELRKYSATDANIGHDKRNKRATEISELVLAGIRTFIASASRSEEGSWLDAASGLAAIRVRFDSRANYFLESGIGDAIKADTSEKESAIALAMNNSNSILQTSCKEPFLSNFDKREKLV